MALESGSPEEDKVKFQKFMVEALHVVEDLLVDEVVARMGNVVRASAEDVYDEMCMARQVQAELENFRKALKQEDEGMLMFFLSTFASDIKASDFGQDFMARQTVPRRTLAQKAERVASIKLRDGRKAMQADVMRMDMTWQNLDSLSQLILQEAN